MAVLPRILVPGRSLAAGRAGRQATVAAGRRYLEAVHRAGGVGLVTAALPLDDDAADQLVDQAHGLLLLGGPDVGPHRYGHPVHPHTYGVDHLQDEFELALLGAARRQQRPVLAICRGLQLVNVAFGGTLHQHLGDLEGLDAHAPAAFPAAEPGSIGPLLPVRIEPGCRLHRLLSDAAGPGGPPGDGAAPLEHPATMPGSAITVSGAHSHHQGVDGLGDGLVVAGRSADGVIEAIEAIDNGHWLVAVQWHPEDTAEHDPAMQAIFDAFVAVAASASAS